MRPKPHLHNDAASIVALGGLVVQWCNGVTQRGGGSLGRGFQRALLEPFSAVSRLSGEWPNASSLGRGFQRALLGPSSAVSELPWGVAERAFQKTQRALLGPSSAVSGLSGGVA